jgi:acyl carrier protein
MSDANRAKLIDLVATILELDPGQVHDDLSPDRAPNWDSLNHLNICVAVSQEFGVALTTAQMASLGSVGAIVKLLNARGVACAHGAPGHG